uniref:Oxidoreductase NAD-binding domain containing 1 n=1 Tax=Oncorhynchus kisutch TaxID=8019 RepID=A0A8C7CVZ6_ONCKI
TYVCVSVYVSERERCLLVVIALEGCVLFFFFLSKLVESYHFLWYITFSVGHVLHYLKIRILFLSLGLSLCVSRVDFFIPGMEKVGGFSVCSSPGLLQREGVIELAVKYTEHPPPHICTMDSHVAMRVGGNFFFDPLPSDSCVDLMLGAWALTLYTPSWRGYNIGSTHLCYSAKNAQELLFKKTIIDVCKEFPEKFSCDIHITAQMADIDQELQPSMYRGRLSEVGSCVATSTLTLLCYLCGPPPMIESVVQTLLSLGLSQDRILFEKWW